MMSNGISDDEIIKRRLLIDGDGTGDARFMAKFTKAFIKWCNEDTVQENHLHCERLLMQLAAIEQTALKWSKVIEMNTEEVENYKNLRERTAEEVEEAIKSIEIAKKDLGEARQVRKNRLEYDALAKLIKEHPPRSDTANKLAELMQEINSLKTTRDQLEEKLSLKRKQLHTLVTALHELQSSYDSEFSGSKSKVDDHCETIDLTDELMEIT